MVKQIRDIITTLLAALVIFVIIQLTIGSFKVYGLSMLPSVYEGDYILVNKASYVFTEPERGEIIVFRSPRNPESDLIKRIIALPGETVEIKGGKVFIDGSPLTEQYVMESCKYEMPPQEVPADHYFVLGDNRNNSADSHNGWFMPRSNIIGKAWFHYWPPQNWRPVANTVP